MTQPAPGAFVRDPGLQPERTSLAWTRTGLAVAANAVLILRAGISEDRSLVLALGAALMLAAGGIVVLGSRRKRELMLPQTPRAPLPALMMAVVAVAAAAGLAAAYSILAWTPG